jgi:DNA-binding PadR family transcriptional regulator
MRSDLELFVLALVKQGLSTKYDLREKAGVSLGSTVPVLERLEAEHLIKGSEKGLRRSRRFSITDKGSKALSQGWAEYLAMRQNDIDSILRIIYLAWLNGDTQACARFMERSAEERRGWAMSRRAEADRLAATIGEIPDGDAFRWLRTYCEATRAEGEANALLELCAQMNKKNSKKKRKVSQRERNA